VRATSSIARAAKRAWIPLVLLVVLPISTMGVYAVAQGLRLAGLNAKRRAGDRDRSVQPQGRRLRGLRPVGSTANINYWDENANTHQVNAAALPWSFTISTTLPAVSANSWLKAMATRSAAGSRSTVSCRSSRISMATTPRRFCLVSPHERPEHRTHGRAKALSTGRSKAVKAGRPSHGHRPYIPSRHPHLRVPIICLGSCDGPAERRRSHVEKVGESTLGTDGTPDARR